MQRNGGFPHCSPSDPLKNPLKAYIKVRKYDIMISKMIKALNVLNQGLLEIKQYFQKQCQKTGNRPFRV
jgi:hypothetical protein